VRKYWHVINIGIQNTLVYRVNFLLRSIFGFIPLLATISLWKAIYSEKGAQETINGFTLSAMISYYLLVTVVDALTAVAEDDFQIAGDIREGRISQFLLKPIDYLSYRLCLFFSGRLIYMSIASIPVAVFVFCFRDHFHMPASQATLGWFFLSLILTGLLQFFISYTMALLAFWVLEVSTFIFILFAFEYIAGGHLFPLSVLPQPIYQLLHFTPFPYQMFFPVSIFMEKTSGTELYRGLCFQAGWVLLFFLAARWMWSRGIRKYTAFGG
jgi:ABC-2 type transport system permease protein